MESILLLVFSCLDIVFFYVFFESVLIPMYLILGFFGSRERKILASYMFFIYTFVGSVLMLLAILFIFYYTGTTNYIVLLTCNFDPFLQKLLWIAFFVSFAVKVPMLPFYIWLPEAHVEAPTPGSVILAGIVASRKLLHSDKAYLPIVSTVSGISIFSRPVHPANKNCAICVIPVSNVTFFN